MTRLLASAAAAAFLLTPAVAAAQDWTGPYISVFGGVTQAEEDDETIEFDTDLDGQFGDTVFTAAPADAFSPGFCSGAASSNVPAGGCSDDDEGADFGGRIGYDMQWGSFVVGVLGEASFVDFSDSVSAFSTTPASYTMTREIDQVWAVRARAGVAFDRFLPYVTAGWAMAEVDSSFATTNGVNTFVERGSGDADGMQWGAGVEARVWDNWTFGLEWIRTDLDDGDYRVRAQGPAPVTNPFILVNPAGTDFRRSDDSFEFDSFRVTASYRF